jgi:homogentisate 1,2-dioxygenase
MRYALGNDLAETGPGHRAVQQFARFVLTNGQSYDQPDPSPYLSLSQQCDRVTDRVDFIADPDRS